MQLSRNNRLLVLSACLFGLISSSNAEIYKQVQPDGSVTYTNTPKEGQPREKVDLKPIAIIPSIDPESVSFEPETQSRQIKFDIEISSPAAGATFHNEEADAIPLSINVEPQTFGPYQLQVSVDGKSISPKSSTLPFMYRGEHTVQVEVVGANGKAIASQSVTFYVHRFAGG